MDLQLRGIGTVLVAVATVACGVLMLGGVGPAPAGAGLTGDPLASVAPITSVAIDQAPPTSPPGSEPTTTLSTTSTSTSSTTTTSSSPSTTTLVVTPSPVPISVTASQTVVGIGGTVDFSGECPSPSGEPLGPVIVWVIGETTVQIATGVTAVDWTYRWTAPTDPNEIVSYAFQFWCGDPSGWEGGYPASLQRTVDIVAQAGPAPTTTPLVEPDPPNVIPETG